MPYVSEFRSSGVLRQSYSVPGTEVFGFHQARTRLEAVYSFRTGKRADNIKPGPSDTYIPPRGDLLGTLSYRKKYLDREINDIVANQTGAPSHFLLADVGHEFGISKMKMSIAENSGLYQYPNGNVQMVNLAPSSFPVLTRDGSMVITNPNTDFDSFFISKGLPFASPGTVTGPSLGTIRGIASEHINRVNPVQTKISLLTTLLEVVRGDVPGLLRDLRRHKDTIERLRRDAKSWKDAGATLGGEYLNVQFGWAPLIRDIANSLQLLATIDQMLFPPDSTRRKVEQEVYFRASTSENSHAWSLAPPIHVISGTEMTEKTVAFDYEGGTFSPVIGMESTLTASEKLSVFTTVRFNTSMRPTAINNGYLDQFTELMGLELTPSVIWELTPWTWLLDWFSNIGTVVENLSNLNLSGVILNYCYSTARREVSSGVWSRPSVGSNFYQFASFSGNPIASMQLDQKVRIAASPFGFDVATDSLNAGQWAILVALGLARSR